MVKRAYQSSFLISIQVDSIILSDITGKKLHLFVAQQRFLSECSSILSLFRISLWLCTYVIAKPVFLFVSSFKFLFPFTFVFFDRFGPSRNISLVGFNNRN